MKGIVLAGGSGTRLRPATSIFSKQLLPIYDKPMIYYSLSVLMQAKIKEILIICTDRDLESYKALLGDGSQLGISLHYKVQPSPDGIASAFILGKEFIKKDSVCLILGDNIFYSYGLSNFLSKEVKKVRNNAFIFGYKVSNPQDFGVVEFTKDGKVKKIIEKPKRPRSNYAVVGLYLYDNRVIEYAQTLKPSKRGELEITDLNNIYLKNGKLNVSLLEEGFAWLDTGTHQSLLDASQFVSTLEKRQGIKIGCLEEISYRNQWISKKQLKLCMKLYEGTDYEMYLKKILKSK